jgi:apolipoprotein N-acyltransferase
VLIAELLIVAYKKNILKTTLLLKTALACVLLAATILYGKYRIKQSENTVSNGPLVASLQSNVPQTIKEMPDASEKIFTDLLELSKDACETGAELIVWPETMVQAILNESVWSFLVNSQNAGNFDKALKEHSKDNAFLLIGAAGGKIRQRDNTDDIYLDRYNTAFLYEPTGRQSKTKYNKIHLVPFGEVIPFKYSAPWIHKFFMLFTPYDYDYSLEYGTEYTIFAITSGDKKDIYKFGVMICYEDAVPLIARKFALDEQGQKRIDWLINISNDGWFVKLKEDKILTTTELNQHAAICVFRAVENRLAVLRSVNTGISCLIDTLGRIKNGFTDGTLPYQAMERKGIAGWFADKMPIDKRVTFFSKHGQWLDFSCAICFVLPIIAQIGAKFLRSIKNKKAAK